MDSMFLVNIDTPIYLYGAGKVGLEKAKQLLAFNANFRGIIDRDAKDIKCEFNVISVEDILEKGIDSNSLIVITLQDCSKHIMIAEYLHKSLGVSRILFFPMALCGTREYVAKMRDAYNIFMYNLQELMHYSIPKIMFDVREDIISITGDFVSFYADKEYIYSATEEIISNGVVNNTGILKEYMNVPVLDNRIYTSLIDYLYGNGDAILYCSAFEKEGREAEDYLENRKLLFDFFTNAYELDYSMFEKSPCLCKWNDNGYFNIVDGNHRLYFLLSRGRNKIPIITSMEEYNHFKKFEEKRKNA